MPIDFAQIETGEKFELLCEDLLRAMGFTIVEKASRGADDGTDLIVSQTITDMTGFTEERTILVQCKHWAEGGKAVPYSKVSNYREAMDEDKVRRYLLITSTLAIIDLQRKFKAVTDKGEYVALIWSAADLTCLLDTPPTSVPATFPSSPNLLPPNPAASRSSSATPPATNPPSATSTTAFVPWASTPGSTNLVEQVSKPAASLLELQHEGNLNPPTLGLAHRPRLQRRRKPDLGYKVSRSHPGSPSPRRALCRYFAATSSNQPVHHAHTR